MYQLVINPRPGTYQKKGLNVRNRTVLPLFSHILWNEEIRSLSPSTIYVFVSRWRKPDYWISPERDIIFSVHLFFCWLQMYLDRSLGLSSILNFSTGEGYFSCSFRICFLLIVPSFLTVVVVLAALVLAVTRTVRMAMILASFILYSFISKVRQALYWNVSVLWSRLWCQRLAECRGSRASISSVRAKNMSERASLWLKSILDRSCRVWIESPIWLFCK